MIDTGSSKTLISPRLVKIFFSKFVQNEPFSIQSAHNITHHDFIANIPLPDIFKSQDFHKFYIFEFNPQYDGLIGTDLLKKLESKIDFKNKTLITKNANITIYSDDTGKVIRDEKNVQHYQIKLQPRTTTIVQVPVDLCEGNALMNYKKFASGAEMPAAIVNTKNNFATTAITNPTERTINIKFLTPMNAQKFNVQEINNYDGNRRI